MTYLNGASMMGDGSGSETTTSTDFVDFPDAELSILTGNRRVLIGFAGTCYNTSANQYVRFTFNIDGTDIAASEFAETVDSAANAVHNASFTYLTDALEEGVSHTFKLRWKVSGGTGTVRNPPWHFYVMEQP